MKMSSAPLKTKAESGLTVSFLRDVTDKLNEGAVIAEHHF